MPSHYSSSSSTKAPLLSAQHQMQTPDTQQLALPRPCCKCGEIIGATLKAAIKLFPPESIFVVINGNSLTPLDKHRRLLRPVRRLVSWSPLCSKIIARFVGCHFAERFPNILLIDDYCLLPTSPWASRLSQRE